MECLFKDDDLYKYKVDVQLGGANVTTYTKEEINDYLNSTGFFMKEIPELEEP